jgi:hypothetical protein
MLAFLISILPILKIVGKWLGIGLIIVSIILLPWLFIHQYGDRHYTMGHKDGYAQAIKENPPQTYGDNATVNNIYGVIDPLFNISVHKLGFGFFWRK